jgi:3',5'-cyclic AMP phosphodiesterase CpdA
MKIIQLTDTHLVPPGERLYTLDPADQLRRAVADIAERHADANLVVITGDLCNDGDPAAYALLREILTPLPCPVRLLLGNHDERQAFRAAFPEQPVDAAGFVQSFMDTPEGRLLFLDSNEPFHIGGRYCEKRQAWLEEALAGADEQPVTVFIHHPPLPDDLAHFEHIGLHDAEAVMALLRAHQQQGGRVRHIVFGHMHVLTVGTSADGFSYSCGQAPSHRFIAEPDNPQPWWTGGNPCYRVLMLDDKGFRAYHVEVDEPALMQAPECLGP